MKFLEPPVGFLEVCGTLQETSDRIVDLIDSSEEEQLTSLLLDPGNSISWKNAVSLALHNEKIFSFFERNPVLQHEWARRLRSRDYPDFAIPFSSGKGEYSIFSQFVGAYMWVTYKKIEETDKDHASYFLDTACAMGNYDAWIKKIDHLTSDWKSLGGDESFRTLICSTLEFAENFWSAGYFNAGIVLMDVALYCKDTLKNNETVSIAIEAAIEAFMTGFFLERHQHSQAILNVFYPVNGWIDIFCDYSDQWCSLGVDGAQNHLMESIRQNFEIDGQELYFPAIAANANKKVEKILERFPLEMELEMKLPNGS